LYSHPVGRIVETGVAEVVVVEVVVDETTAPLVVVTPELVAWDVVVELDTELLA
jgi:hypothetical protein